MKRYALGFLSVMLLCPAAHATGINILSEQNGLYLSTTYYYPGGGISTYSESWSGPPHSISIGTASGSIDNFSIELEGTNRNYNESMGGPSWISWTGGYALYFFTSDFSNLSISASGYNTSDHISPLDVRFEISDLTTGTDSYDYYFRSQGVTYFNFTDDIIIDSSHEYRLAMDVSTSGSIGYVSSGLTVNLSSSQPVPEPATLLLIGTGVVGLVGSRRKGKTTNRASRLPALPQQEALIP